MISFIYSSFKIIFETRFILSRNSQYTHQIQHHQQGTSLHAWPCAFLIINKYIYTRTYSPRNTYWNCSIDRKNQLNGMTVFYRCEFSGARNFMDFEIMSVFQLLGPSIYFAISKVFEINVFEIPGFSSIIYIVTARTVISLRELHGIRHIGVRDTEVNLYLHVLEHYLLVKRQDIFSVTSKQHYYASKP